MKIEWKPIPAMQIMNVFMPMMAKSKGWPVGKDLENRIRMTNRYISIASILNYWIQNNLSSATYLY